MNLCLAICIVCSLVIIHCNTVFSYHPDWSWENVETMMSPDLKSRMKKRITSRRRYCDCSDVGEDAYPICANNGILYPNECLFECNKIRLPGLAEAEDYVKCGPMTFKEFKLEEFRPHY